MARLAVDPPTFLQLARQGRAVAPGHRLVSANALRSRALELLLPEAQNGQLDDRAAQLLQERITEIPVRLLGDRVSRRVAWQLALQNNWADLRDAEYIAVARLQADALVTVDPDLAAKAADLVPMATFEDLFTR